MKHPVWKRLDETVTGFRNHTMVLPDAAQDILDSERRLKAEVKLLREENEAKDDVLRQCLEQACGILDRSPSASVRIASMSLRGFMPRPKATKRRRK